MKNHSLVLVGALRAAVWKTTPIGGSVPISVPIIWAIAAVGAEVAREYFQIPDSAGFSAYGLNSTLAGIAVAASVLLLFAFAHRTLVLSVAFALDVVRNIVAIVGDRFTTAIYWPSPSGIWTHSDTVILQFLLVSVWWIGAFAAILRSIDFYRGTVARATGAYLALTIAVALLPTWPTFVGPDFNYHTFNLWERTLTWFDHSADNQELHVDRAKLELSQGALLDGEIRNLLPERKGTTDIYAIGIAGWSGQDVFPKELNGALASLEKAIAMDRGAIRLVNHADTIEQAPIASRTNFASAVHYLAGIMNKDEDVLLILITSHGSPAGVGLLLGDAMRAILSPDDIAFVLAREGIRNRIIIVSACYAGVFMKPLSSQDSIVITAADENNPSFGCSNERDWTYFGDAFFNQSLKSGVSLERAFDDAKARISEWEVRDDIPSSNPQAHFGRSLSEKLASRINTNAQVPQPANGGDRRASTGSGADSSLR